MTLAECLISLLVFVYAGATVWAIHYIKIHAGKRDMLWLTPFVMLVTALLVKVAAHEGSSCSR